jgi:FixJ family two-component response regulator
MPKMDGVGFRSRKKIKPEIPIVMISGHGDMETAINTMRLELLIIFLNHQI